MKIKLDENLSIRLVAKEALDFIGNIELKHGLKDRPAEEIKLAQTPAMKHVWDNYEDEVWNDV